MSAMLKRAAILAILPFLAACQTQSLQHADIDQDCLIKKGGSRLLSKAIGFGLGAAGVPAGGLAGRAVGYATKPNCEIVRQQKQ